MARQRLRELPIVCRSYGVKPVLREKDLPREVMDEAFKMNRLWNTFVEIGESFREKYQAVLGKDSDVARIKEEYDAATTEVAEAYDALKKARVKHRTRKSPLLVPFEESYSALKHKRSEIGSRLKEAKAKVKEYRKGELKEVGAAFLKKIDEEWKKAYREYLYWANANAVKDSYLKAWQRGLKIRGWPKFHRFQGEARFCHQFIGGKETEKIFTTSTRCKLFHIKPIDTSVYSNPDLNPHQKRKQCRTTMTFQIGGIPIEFHITLHREIPDGFVKQVVLTRRRTGTNIDWSVSFTIEKEGGDISPAAPKSEAAAIDLGFRIIDGALRIGVLVAADKREELWLHDSIEVPPGKILLSRAYAKAQQSKRDKLVEEMKKKVFDQLLADLPPELKVNWEKARQPRLVKIMQYLKENGHFLADELEKWFRADRKLFNEVSGLTARALRHRKWHYYNMVNRLCSEYGTIVIEKLNMSKLSRREKADGSANELVQAAREYRTIAALGEFVSLLKNVAKKRKVLIEETDAAYTTLKCHVCGEMCSPADRTALELVCEHCNASFDQDVNAAHNLYNYYLSSGAPA